MMPMNPIDAQLTAWFVDGEPLYLADYLRFADDVARWKAAHIVLAHPQHAARDWYETITRDDASPRTMQTIYQRTGIE